MSHKMPIVLLVCIIISSAYASGSFAWDGTDYESGSNVEIDDDYLDLVREGEEIEYYDYESGVYRTVEVKSVESNGSGTDVEVYDYESGEYRTLQLD